VDNGISHARSFDLITILELVLTHALKHVSTFILSLTLWLENVLTLILILIMIRCHSKLPFAPDSASLPGKLLLPLPEIS
jgi:hypothetical protein